MYTIDKKLKNYLTKSGIKNLEEIKSVRAFGIGYNYGVDYDPAIEPRISEHQIFCFDELKPEYDKYFLEYYRIQVVFKNGHVESWEFYPQEWEEINEELEKEDKLCTI